MTKLTYSQTTIDLNDLEENENGLFDQIEIVQEGNKIHFEKFLEEAEK